MSQNRGASEHQGEQWADGGPFSLSQRVVVLYALVNLAPGPIKRICADSVATLLLCPSILAMIPKLQYWLDDPVFLSRVMMAHSG